MEELMRRMLGIVLIATLTVLATAARGSRMRPEHFSVVLDYTPTGWSAQCEVGCSHVWRASFACDTACDARVDGVGLVTLLERRPWDDNFGFTVTRTADGVAATAHHGTAWTELSWGCGGPPCRARITEAGVALLGR